MLTMIIFVLELFKFPVTLNAFTRFPSYTNFIFATISYRSSSSLSCCCSLAAVGPYGCSLASSSSSLATGFFFFFYFFFHDVPSVHIPFSPSSCYITKKQYHVRSTAFLQVHLVLLSQVLIQRFVILKLHFSNMYSSFILYPFEKFFDNFIDTLKQPLNRYF